MSRKKHLQHFFSWRMTRQDYAAIFGIALLITMALYAILPSAVKIDLPHPIYVMLMIAVALGWKRFQKVKRR